ncbi:hypothetical protein [Desulfosarcina sp.]|uniref:hypothetical protein n=1 Tax=Desulfosarcina sp. TaxID=2027861 RepID=UPI0029B78559|nr:hypothetical protein [Desulfosarcina sp.]MDX2452410.1 hypothetical protein [Desulfosarcina sp.]MDX2490187.1 hypothetical protein [Desulfosarcina sp.]
MQDECACAERFSFGESARYTSAQGYARTVTRGEALTILIEAEQAGLIHKAFHPGSKESRPETSICNCCKDCCDTRRIWREESACLCCGVCARFGPESVISLKDGLRKVVLLPPRLPIV